MSAQITITFYKKLRSLIVCRLTWLLFSVSWEGSSASLDESSGVFHQFSLLVDVPVSVLRYLV